MSDVQTQLDILRRKRDQAKQTAAQKRDKAKQDAAEKLKALKTAERVMLALALLAFATALHFHDTANERDHACVFCHACGARFIASPTQDNLDPTFGGHPHAQAPERVRNVELRGNGSRAPPA